MYSQIQKSTGIDCPKCGYNGTKQVDGSEKWSRWSCPFCGYEFTSGSRVVDEVKPTGVIWRRVRCPSCKSAKVPVHTTRGATRYHKCDACGVNFKSVEV